MRSRWTRFWFAPISTENLALLRIFFGAAFFMKITGMARLFVGEAHTIRFPRHAFIMEEAYFLSSFRLPVPGFAWLSPPSFDVYRAVESWILVLCALFIAGFLTRWLGPILAIMYGYLFVLTQFTYSHHVFLFLIVLAVLAWSRCSDNLSVDAYLSVGRSYQSGSVLPLRMIQVLVTLIYLFSFASKLNQGWLDGMVMTVLIEDGRIDGILAPLVTMAPAQLLSITVVMVEGFLVFGLWNKRLRSTAILVGLFMHISIDMMMDVTTFGIQMMVLYIAFIDPVARKTAVFYDGACSLCTRSVKLLMLFDWFRRFTWLDFRDQRVRGLVRCVSTKQLESQIVLITATGGIKIGFHACKHILTKLPLTFIFSHLLHLPLISSAGNVLYRMAARSRLGVVHCLPGECEKVSDHAPQSTEEIWMDGIRIANSRLD